MNSLNDPVRQSPQLFSACLGEMAANPQQPLYFQSAETPGSRLQALLAYFRNRSQAREHAMHKLKLNELAAPE
jgi:hypothetical protein